MTTELITMPEQQLHPGLEDLTAFSVGQLSPEEAETVEAHIGECAACCETLMGLSTDDTFVGLLQQTRDPVGGVTIDAAERALATERRSGNAVPSALAEHPRYAITELIATGGMGDVFRAEHRMMERTVAIKVINHELMRNSEAVERFHREVRTAAQLSHPNIVRAYDAEQADGIHFLVMECVDGINLADLVKKDGPLSVSKACEYARQAAIGLQHAHEQGMVHRDIKPHNLMLTEDGTIKILDFGLASLAAKSVVSLDPAVPEHASLTAAGAIMGTPDFISPEQAADAHKADIRSDIYSLGATLHYLLCGHAPFAEGSVAERLRSHAEAQPTSINSLRDDAPEELSDIIIRMMSKDPNHRFQTPQDVADALAPFVDRYRTDTAGEAVSSGAGRKSWWPPSKFTAIACAAFGFLLSGIIYLETNKGTLVIESVDDDVNVTISKVVDKDGEDYLQLSVVDTVTGSKVVRLPSGDYKVSLGERGNEYELNQGGFTLRRGGDVVIRVTRKEQTKKDGSKPVAETSPLRAMPVPAMAQQTLMMQGFRLSDDQAKELQSKAEADPDDVESRLQLLGYYQRNSILNPELRERQVNAISWLVKNYPEAAGHMQTHIHASIDPNGYMQVKKLWLANIEAHPRNAKVLGNAAKYFLQSDRTVAEVLLKKAQAIEPGNADWAEQLGQLYKLGIMFTSGPERQQAATEALAQFERAMKQNEVPQRSSSLLVDVAKMALAAGDTEKTKMYAEQLLKVGEADEQDWNSGNATHHANLILGSLALKLGKVEESGAFLLAAGKTSGSPQLNSFGPNMSLAKELLEQGEKDVVLEYFELCGQFWKNDKLKQWTAVVKGGGIPAFGGNLAY